MHSMSGQTLLVLLCTVAMTTGAPSSGEGSSRNVEVRETEGVERDAIVLEKRSIRSPDEESVNAASPDEVFPDPLDEINEIIDPEILPSLSNYLRCTVCLTECMRVRTSALAYYLCTRCIRNCSGNLHAFMHFFSTRQCTVLPDPLTEVSTNSIPSTPGGALPHTTMISAIGDQNLDPTKLNGPFSQSSDNVDYVDDYINSRYFSNDAEDMCELKQEKYKEMEARLSQCMTDVDYLKSNLGLTSPGSEGAVNYYDGIDYPEESPDQERSAYPTLAVAETWQMQTRNIPHRVEQMKNLIPGYTSPETGGHITTDTPTIDIQRSNLLNERILKEYRSRFTTVKEIEASSTQRWTENPVSSIKSMGGVTMGHEREGRLAVCPTTFKQESPLRVKHHTGLTVTLLRLPDYQQSFYVAECQFAKPTVSTKDDKATCEVVYSMQKALLLTNAKLALSPNSGLKNCRPHDDGSGRYLCDDWIVLPGACSMYI